MFLPKSLDEARLWLDQHGVKGVTVNELLRLGVTGYLQICTPVSQAAYSPTKAAKAEAERFDNGIYDYDINKANKEATGQIVGLYALSKKNLFELDIKRNLNVRAVHDLETDDLYFVDIDVSVDELRVTSKALENLLSRCEVSQEAMDNQAITLPVMHENDAVILPNVILSTNSSELITKSGGNKTSLNIKAMWIKEAWRVGTIYMNQWRDAGYQPTKDDIGLYVEGYFANNGTHNTTGNIIDRATIIREALTGITGKRRGQKCKKKIPAGERQTE